MSGVPEQAWSALADLLERQTADVRELQGLLEQETAAVAAEETQQILALAGQKQRLAARLADTTRALDAALQRHGFTPDAGGLARCAATAGNPRLQQGRQEAMRALRECAAHNRANGALVERKRSAVERALRIFFDPADAPQGRYHPSGRLEGYNPNRSIGEA